MKHVNTLFAENVVYVKAGGIDINNHYALKGW
jgi:hypothetical protein